jgi:hypothetical protein
MTKLSTGAVIPYGALLPPATSSLDGSLFYKTIDSGEGSVGLYFFGLLPDGASGTFGDQPVLGWVRSISTSVGADTLGGLPASAFQQVNVELSALINQSSTGFYVRTGSGTSAARTLVAGSTRLSITNPNGVSGNPILDVSEANLSLANIGGVLPVSKGGTGATSTIAGGIVFGNASTYGISSAGATGQILLSGGTGSPTWASQSTLTVGSATSATTAATATTATRLATARSISITGDGTWTTSFDGSANSTGTLTLASVATAGTFGSSSLIPVLTVDQKGRVTGVSTTSVTASTSNTLATARNIAITGDATWSVSFNGSANVSSDIILTTVNANPGTFGSSTLVPQITVDSKGRITSVAQVPVTTAANADTANQLTTARTISASGDASWSVSFNGAANVDGTLNLTTVNSNVGSFGSASAIPVVTVDAKGRVTAVSTQTSIFATSVTNGVYTVGDQSVGGIKTFTSVRETLVALGSGSGTRTINLANGNYFTNTVTGASTIAVSNVAASGTVSSFILELVNGGSAAITWFSGVTWAQGSGPSLTTTGTDIIGFYTNNGGVTWRGLVLALDIKA